VTIEARAHRERNGLLDDIHILDVPVAVHAVDAPVHMNAVIEIGVVRHAMDPLPGDRGSLFVELRQFNDLRAILATDGNDRIEIRTVTNLRLLRFIMIGL
jgi:hypothetical protein